MGVTFITAIDTDAGKTFATGLIARCLAKSGASTITAKIAQTGSEGFSIDLALHRRLMGISTAAEDAAGLTCPAVFPFPASPHLSARLAGTRIDPAAIAKAVARLAGNHEEVVVEGVGGWLVPLTEELTLADFVAGQGWPVVVVTSPRLGSINHTLLTLEAVRSRGVKLLGGVFNTHDAADPAISEDSFALLKKAFAPAPLVPMPSVLDPDSPPDVDFSALFGGGR